MNRDDSSEQPRSPDEPISLSSDESDEDEWEEERPGDFTMSFY